jgi:hypothetical protein
VAGINVSGFAYAHEGSPAAGNKCSRTRSSDGWRSVDAAGPVGGDEVLVSAKGGRTIENGTVSFGSEPVFVCVARDGGYAFETEIEEFRFEAGFFEERDEKRTETTVYVKRNLAFEGDLGERGDVVDDSMREVGG